MRYDDKSTVPIASVLKVIRAIQNELDTSGEEDVAVRFEIFGDYIEEEIIKFGKPMDYTSKMIGI